MKLSKPYWVFTYLPRHCAARWRLKLQLELLTGKKAQTQETRQEERIQRVLESSGNSVCSLVFNPGATAVGSPWRCPLEPLEISYAVLCSFSFLTWLPAGPNTKNTWEAPGSLSAPFWDQRQVCCLPQGVPRRRQSLFVGISWPREKGSWQTTFCLQETPVAVRLQGA